MGWLNMLTEDGWLDASTIKKKRWFFTRTIPCFTINEYFANKVYRGQARNERLWTQGNYPTREQDIMAAIGLIPEHLPAPTSVMTPERETELLRRHQAPVGTAGTGLSWTEIVELHQHLVESGKIHEMEEDYKQMALALQDAGEINGYEYR